MSGPGFERDGSPSAFERLSVIFYMRGLIAAVVELRNQVLASLKDATHDDLERLFALNAIHGSYYVEGDVPAQLVL